MKRYEEIKDAAEEYANGSPNATLRHKAFKDGAKWADEHPQAPTTYLNRIWHDANEKPEEKRCSILAKDEREGHFTLYKLIGQDWTNYVAAFNIMRWAYISDLLPGNKEDRI